MSPVVFIPIEAPSTPFALFQNTPNPFNPTTTISFALPEPAHVTLSIYNLLGQEVIRLMDEYRPAGRYSVFWNGENTSGQPVASGLYLYRLQTDKAGITRKMSLLR
jgi:flagellar hook assembly protein FlgD